MNTFHTVYGKYFSPLGYLPFGYPMKTFETLTSMLGIFSKEDFDMSS